MYINKPDNHTTYQSFQNVSMHEVKLRYESLVTSSNINIFGISTNS